MEWGLVVMPLMLDTLMSAIDESGRSYDKARITEVYEFAKAAHSGQVRDSGDPYVSHPVAVSVILVELGMDEDSICLSHCLKQILVFIVHDVVDLVLFLIL